MLQRVLNWFRPQSRGSAAVAPERQEPLSRREGYAGAYRAWLERGDARVWSERLREAFNLHRAGLDPQDDSIDFLAFRATAGFVIHLQNECPNPEEIHFLLDLLRDRVRACGYRVALSDRRVQAGRMVEKHYLKPPIHREGGQRAAQGYGNITIEVQYRDERLLHLRFIVTHYQDRAWLPPDDPNELFERLTDE